MKVDSHQVLDVFKLEQRVRNGLKGFEYKTCEVMKLMLIFMFSQFVTLLAMWVIPLGICAQNLWWRFIFTWLVFSCITGLIVRKALQHPIQGTTPRLVNVYIHIYVFFTSILYGM